MELYEFQAKEIDDAQPVAGEHEELTARSRLLSNLEKIKRTAGAAYGALYEEEGSIIERLRGTLSVLLELTELDESLQGIATQVKDAAAGLDDSAFSLRRYVDKLDLDPAELTEVNNRLNLINRLIDKYTGRVAGAGLDEVLSYRQQIGEHIEELRTKDQDFSTIGKQIAALETKLSQVGRQLTAARKKSADKLLPRVHEQLADLGMKEARFLIEFQTLDIALGGDETAQRHKGTKAHRHDSVADSLSASMPQSLSALSVNDFSTASGLETVEFMIAPNPGQPARPLRRIASGGELSRVMLALKGILAQADRVSVLVFDEIDANVGGRMGTIIGEKLRALATVHQVLCITHLPQIAAFADRHLTIRKNTGAGETVTTVTVVDGDSRIQELAEMTSGKDVTPTALAQARELLDIAQQRAPVPKAKSSLAKSKK